MTEDNNGILVSLVGPDWGYRLIDIDGSSTGNNPPMGLEVTLSFADGTTETRSDTILFEQQLLLSNVDIVLNSPMEVTMDIFGNQGEWIP